MDTFEALYGPANTAVELGVPTATQTEAVKNITNYVVAEGDTLSSIAVKFDLSISTVAWANQISTDDLISVGQELIILPFDGVRHVVESGDTFSVLAERYAVGTDEIMEFNKIARAEELQPGDELLIPGGSVANSYLWGRGGSDDHTEDHESEVLGVATASTNSVVRSSAGADVGEGLVHPVPGSVVTQGRHGKNGIDFGAPHGSTVRAVRAGTVIKVVDGYNGGYGKTVVISHADGTQTLYAHLSTISVANGSSVDAGQTIGYVGSTGRSTGPHLHFEVKGASNPYTNCSYLSRCGS